MSKQASKCSGWCCEELCRTSLNNLGVGFPDNLVSCFTGWTGAWQFPGGSFPLLVPRDAQQRHQPYTELTARRHAGVCVCVCNKQSKAKVYIHNCEILPNLRPLQPSLICESYPIFWAMGKNILICCKLLWYWWWKFTECTKVNMYSSLIYSPEELAKKTIL